MKKMKLELLFVCTIYALLMSIHYNVYAEEITPTFIYHFESIEDGTSEDSSINSVDAVLSSSVMQTSGIQGNGIFMNGKDSSVQLNTTKFNLTKTRTFLFWFKPKINSLLYGSGCIMKYGDSINISYGYQTNRITVNMVAGQNVCMQPEFVFTNDVWYQIALTCDESVARLYVNDILVCEEETGGRLIPDGSTVTFGSDDENYFRGCLDEILYFNKCVEKQQIEKMYNELMKGATSGNTEDFPFSLIYTNGITPANLSLFRNSSLKKPIDTGFENRDEIFETYNNTLNGAVTISENKYSGKFALKLTQNTNSILPIKESEYFQIGSTPVEQPLFRIYTIEKTIYIEADLLPNSNVGINIYTDGLLAASSQRNADSSGKLYYQSIDLAYRLYSVEIDYYKNPESLESEKYIYYVNVADNSLYTQTDIADISNITEKSNYIELMVKPMSESKYVSFYTKSCVKDSSNNVFETYTMIKSDNNKDGIFEIGDDLSRGEWHKIVLNLNDIDTEIENNAISGLYVCANVGSEWLFDDVSTGYKKVNKTWVELLKMAGDNVVFDESLRFFVKSSNSYDNKPAVVMGNVSVSEQISGFEVNDGIVNLEGQEVGTSTERDIKKVDFSAQECSVYENGYDTTYTGASSKALKVQSRSELPQVPDSNSMTIEFDEENELRYRLVFYCTSKIAITDSAGNEVSYTSTSDDEYFYSDWYDDDITLSVSSPYTLSQKFGIYEIQYEALDETRKDLVMEGDSVAEILMNGFETDGRAKINMTYRLEENIFLRDQSEHDIEFLFYNSGSEEPYYTVVKHINEKYNNNIKVEEINFDFIVPRIQSSTVMVIRNIDASGNYSSNIRILDIEIGEVLKEDCSVISETKDCILESVTTYSDINLSDVILESEQYAVEHLNASVKTAGAISTTLSSNSSYLIRYVNLSDSNYTDYAEKYELQYGENELIINTSDSLSFPIKGEKVYILSIIKYTPHASEIDEPLYIDGFNGYSASNYAISKNNECIYYSNIYDRKTLYRYNFVTKQYEKLLDEPVYEVAISDDESLCAVKTATNGGKIINLSKGTTQDIDYGNGLVFNADNELYAIYISNDEILWKQFMDGNTIEIKTITSSYIDSSSASYAFDSSGDNLVIVHRTSSKNARVILYKKYNGIWTEVKNFEVERASGVIDVQKNIYLTDDVSTVYISKDLVVDINSETLGSADAGTIKYVCGDTFIVEDNYQTHYLFKPSTQEKYKLFNVEPKSVKYIAYNPESNIITYISKSGGIVRKYFSSNQSDIKYLLSFDGRKTWNAYKNGRWIKASESAEPTSEEINRVGMSSKEVNKIDKKAISELYSNNTDILTVDFAVYMTSTSNLVSPCINSMCVYTEDESQEVDQYSINIQKYNKDDYRGIDTIFPIENLEKNTECYYLLYIGNDWLYTYVDGKLIKVVETAEELLKDIDNSWVFFKQYGMTASQIKAVPGDVLTDLMVNPNYANSEFGVIYVIKSSEDIANNSVDLHLKGREEYFGEEDIVIEVVLNGNDKKIISSQDFTKEEIEKLIDWLERRQNGSGEIFYNIKNSSVQYLLNYYMISSINVYNSDEYNSMQQEETEPDTQMTEE